MFTKYILIAAIIAASSFCAYGDLDINVRETDNLWDKITSLHPTELKASTQACPLIIAGTQCPPANIFVRYGCCGQLYSECCFYFQDWMLLLFVILAAIVIFSAILRILQAICGTRGSRY
uniref:Uncharacterized protein n=1 Tax=Panagrolaimus sp. PS1159 TaxID=55785 RepID=A0AC35FZ03_9BILA